jgi:hypothetical protein
MPEGVHFEIYFLFIFCLLMDFTNTGFIKQLAYKIVNLILINNMFFRFF